MQQGSWTVLEDWLNGSPMAIWRLVCMWSLDFLDRCGSSVDWSLIDFVMMKNCDMPSLIDGCIMVLGSGPVCLSVCYLSVHLCISLSNSTLEAICKLYHLNWAPAGLLMARKRTLYYFQGQKLRSGSPWI